MAVPLSPAELQSKINAIFKHQSQKDRALFPGSDSREFWQRAQDRNKVRFRACIRCPRCCGGIIIYSIIYSFLYLYLVVQGLACYKDVAVTVTTMLCRQLPVSMINWV